MSLSDYNLICKSWNLPGSVGGAPPAVPSAHLLNVHTDLIIAIRLQYGTDTSFFNLK